HDTRIRRGGPSPGRRPDHACFRAGVCPCPHDQPSALACPSLARQAVRVLPTCVCSMCSPFFLSTSLLSSRSYWHYYGGTGPTVVNRRLGQCRCCQGLFTQTTRTTLRGAPFRS